MGDMVSWYGSVRRGGVRSVRFGRGSVNYGTQGTNIIEVEVPDRVKWGADDVVVVDHSVWRNIVRLLKANGIDDLSQLETGRMEK